MGFSRGAGAGKKRTGVTQALGIVLEKPEEWHATEQPARAREQTVPGGVRGKKRKS